MEHTHSTTGRSTRIPRIVWILGMAVIAGVVAIVIFQVPANTVASFSFIALMMFGHLFMHGGHGDTGITPIARSSRRMRLVKLKAQAMRRRPPTTQLAIRAGATNSAQGDSNHGRLSRRTGREDGYAH